ncbi:hypothetical protein [Microvirga massiliensis]|uniref:hypothetical protein n=1 Tax=Microvirga massiliensis TaxID=1033741 RepID=UPI000660E762|nr:hypothetical protein [Microvirga massiliensis]
MGPDWENLLNFCITLLVYDFSEYHRVVSVHDADRIDLELPVSLDDNRITMKPQQAIGLTHQPLRHSIASFKRPGLLGHYQPLLG